MSSCFFSSREKMRISPMSVSRKCFKTVWPNEPVPPVISRVALVNVDILKFLSDEKEAVYNSTSYFLKTFYQRGSKLLKLAFFFFTPL